MSLFGLCATWVDFEQLLLQGEGLSGATIDVVIHEGGDRC